MNLIYYRLIRWLGLSLPALTKNLWICASLVLPLPFSGKTAEIKSEPVPFLAVWMEDDGAGGPQIAVPRLRIAFWDNGKVVFDEKAPQWSKTLRKGMLKPEEVESLKQSLRQTTVLQLKETASLMPDGPEICMMVRIENKQQVLYWDEIESHTTGINVRLTEAMIQFKECWKKLNLIALNARPRETKPAEEPFHRPPRTWREKSGFSSSKKVTHGY